MENRGFRKENTNGICMTSKIDLYVTLRAFSLTPTFSPSSVGFLADKEFLAFQKQARLVQNRSTTSSGSKPRSSSSSSSGVALDFNAFMGFWISHYLEGVKEEETAREIAKSNKEKLLRPIVFKLAIERGLFSPCHSCSDSWWLLQRFFLRSYLFSFFALARAEHRPA